MRVQALRQALHEGLLVERSQAGVGVEQLFQERRARAGEADDEYRVGPAIGITEPSRRGVCQRLVNDVIQIVAPRQRWMRGVHLREPKRMRLRECGHGRIDLSALHARGPKVELNANLGGLGKVRQDQQRLERIACRLVVAASCDQARIKLQELVAQALARRRIELFIKCRPLGGRCVQPVKSFQRED